MIDAVIYGIIPKAKSEAFLNAPPENILIIPNSESGELEILFSKAPLLTPGRIIKEPILYIASIAIVNRILPFSSSMLQIFFRVVINLFIGAIYAIVIVPPDFSMLSLAAPDAALAVIFNLVLISPVPKIFTLSPLLTIPFVTKNSISIVELRYFS